MQQSSSRLRRVQLTPVASKAGTPTISVIVPVYNEAESLPLLYKRLRKVARKQVESFEFIFVDDGSTDTSRQVLAAMEKRDERVRVIEFSRNFSKEIALTAGLNAVNGAAAVILDADLQHPVELIPDFIAKWRGGAEVVVGVRRRYGHESAWKRANSWLFYALLRKLTTTPVTPHATDYRLLDRQVIDAFNQLGERNRMTRGLIDWLGFRRDYVYFESVERRYGTPGYTFKKLFELALNSFVSLSGVPLRFAGWLGIGITALAGLTGVFMFVEKVVLHDPLGLNFSGPAMLAVLNMFWIGIVLSCLGLVALYIASIHAEVINRPLYVVRKPRSLKR